MAGTVIAVAAVLASCVSNDLPYPWVLPNVATVDVQSVDAEGHELLAAPVAVDSASRSITIYLTEYADIAAVKINGFNLSDGSTCVDPSVFDDPVNLTNPLEVEFEKYERRFTWTISAVQSIERYFTVASQVGTATIDVENRTVHALVPMEQPLENLEVRTLKLAGPLAVYSPDLAGTEADFTTPVTVTVTEFGRDAVWELSVEQTEVSVFLTSIDAWTNVAWVYADAEVGRDNGFEYRRADSQEWIKVPADWITVSGGSFYARLINLESQTEYVVRATSDDENSVEESFVTEENVQLPNSDFTQWWKNGKVWNPWAESGESFWDTGNRGSSTLGQSNTTPIEDPMSASGYSGAELKSTFVGVSALGKFASGNLFAGSFRKVDGTDGILDFGRPFTMRPTKLHARLKYTPEKINRFSKTNPDFSSMEGKIDTCIVWCALGDWDQPYEIRTKKSNRRLFSKDDPGVIAYGEWESWQRIGDYIEVTVTLDYRATNRRPKYLLVTASASKYGDYFTGGDGSTLYIKEYWLDYDY